MRQHNCKAPVKDGSNVSEVQLFCNHVKVDKWDTRSCDTKSSTDGRASEGWDSKQIPGASFIKNIGLER